MSYFGEAGFARINLLGDEWRSPPDGVAFLDRIPARPSANSALRMASAREAAVLLFKPVEC